MNNLLLRRYEDGDEKSIVALLNLAMYGWHSLEYWRWKYKRCPYGFYKTLFVAEKDGKIIAHAASVPTRIKFFKKAILGAQSADGATHPDYRHSGFILAVGKKKMEGLREDGIKFTYGIPGKFIYRGLFK
ncbi:MAG: GNAT family N-acetyltransferase, partial [Candidatus Methanofastidiosia archaeon]